jgi:hypothetical protein
MVLIHVERGSGRTGVDRCTHAVLVQSAQLHLAQAICTCSLSQPTSWRPMFRVQTHSVVSTAVLQWLHASLFCAEALFIRRLGLQSVCVCCRDECVSSTRQACFSVL